MCKRRPLWDIINPSAPFGIFSIFSHSFGDQDTIHKTVLHYKWTYFSGYICNPLRVSIRDTSNWLTEKAQWRTIEAFNNVNKHTGHGLYGCSRLLCPANTVRISYYFRQMALLRGSFVHSKAAVIIIIIRRIWWIFLRGHICSDTFSVTFSRIYCVCTFGSFFSNCVAHGYFKLVF